MFKIHNIEINDKVVLAPMAGVTNIVFRKIYQDLGVSWSYTEMTSNVGLKYNSEKTLKYADIEENEGIVSLQIFGGEIDDYVEAAKFYDKNSNASFIDINMGCPVPKVAIKSNAGSALTKTPKKIGEIIKAITSKIKKPLTIKIRIGWDEDNLTYLEVAKIAEENGAAAIAVHGRTRKQMYAGTANWDAIKEIKNTVSIPVIGNGDVKTPQDVKRMLDETNCDAVMIGRAARDNPWLIKQCNEYLMFGEVKTNPTIHDVEKLSYIYYNEITKLRGEQFALPLTRGISSNWLSRFKGVKAEKQALIRSTSFDEYKCNFKKLIDKFKK